MPRDGESFIYDAASNAFMNHYILLLNWTEQGIRTVKDAPKRADNFDRTVKKMGGEATYYYTMGKYDLVAIVNLPDDVSMVKLGLELGRLGNVRSTTLKGWTKQEMKNIFFSSLES
jgi:uncharacterized protein with GYD domain